MLDEHIYIGFSQLLVFSPTTTLEKSVKKWAKNERSNAIGVMAEDNFFLNQKYGLNTKTF